MDISKMNLMNDDFMAIGCGDKVCEIKERFEFMMPMRDGVKLHTVMFLPDLEGPYLLVFSRNPYAMDKDLLEFQGKLFCEHGYAFAHQYCRGIGESEGEWEPFANERNDGIDALQYLNDLDDIEKIGLYGLSYVGYAAWMVLDQLPDKVKCAYIAHFGANRYRQMYCNGLFRSDIYTPWAMWNSNSPKTFTYDDSLKAGLFRPQISADENVFEETLPWYRDWLTRVDEDDPYWTESFWETLKEIPGKVNIPLCLQCGWYDHHFDGMMYGYHALNEDAKHKTRLIIGPWIHEKAPCVEAYDVLDAFTDGYHGYADGLRFMDNILRDEKEQESEVDAYMIGDGWKKFTEWPPKSRSMVLHAGADGHLAENQARQGVISYVYDPDQYVRTHGSECMCYASGMKRGSRLQNSEKRDDVIVFQSDVFEHGLTIAGNIKIDLKVSSDAEDTAFVAKLYEEKKDGRRYNIRTSATTMTYRNGVSHRCAYEPGEVALCTLDMWNILWKMEPGTRLILEISSSSFPEYTVHLNGDTQKWAYRTEAVSAKQNVYFGGEDGTRIYIPVLDERI